MIGKDCRHVSTRPSASSAKNRLSKFLEFTCSVHLVIVWTSYHHASPGIDQLKHPDLFEIKRDKIWNREADKGQGQMRLRQT